MFVYSNLNGLEHMKQVIEEYSLFSNLLNPKEIFTKLSSVISYNLFGNHCNGIVPCEWFGRNISVMKEEEEEFFKRFDTWLLQLEKFVGTENLFKISMTEKELDSFEETDNDSQQNINFLNFLEAYRLNKSLNDSLADKPTGKKKKI